MKKTGCLIKILIMGSIMIFALQGEGFAKNLIISGILVNRNGLPVKNEKIYLFRHSDIGRLFLFGNHKVAVPSDVTHSDGTFIIKADDDFLLGQSKFAIGLYNNAKRTAEYLTNKGVPVIIDVRKNLYEEGKGHLLLDVGRVIFDDARLSQPTEETNTSTDVSSVEDVSTTANFSKSGKEKVNIENENCEIEGTKSIYFIDEDGDGYGNRDKAMEACKEPNGYVRDSSDCNDRDPAERPGQFWYADIDDDGFSSGTTNRASCERPHHYRMISELTSSARDCNDGNASIYPGATEVCNALDDNCNSQVDEGVLQTYYRDGDDDGFGNAKDLIQSCEAPLGYVIDNTDCDDSDFTERPGQTWFYDSDRDGYGSAQRAINACERPSGYVIDSYDCNDSDPAERPGQTWYADADGDGYTDGLTNTTECSRPLHYRTASELISEARDCDDMNSSIYPGAEAGCNASDDN